MNSNKTECGRCGHKWIYTGAQIYKTTCPICRTTVTFKKNKKKINDIEVG